MISKFSALILIISNFVKSQTDFTYKGNLMTPTLNADIIAEATSDKNKNNQYSFYKAWMTQCPTNPQYTELDGKLLIYENCFKENHACKELVTWHNAHIAHPLVPIPIAAKHCYDACASAPSTGGDHRACFKEALAAVTFPASLKSLTQFTPDYKTLYESSEGKTYGLELEAGYWLCQNNNKCLDQFTEYNPNDFDDPWYQFEHELLIQRFQNDTDCAAIITSLSNSTASITNKLNSSVNVCLKKMLNVTQHVDRDYINCLYQCSDPPSFYGRGDGEVDDYFKEDANPFKNLDFQGMVIQKKSEIELSESAVVKQKATYLKEFRTCIKTNCTDFVYYKPYRWIPEKKSADQINKDYTVYSSDQGPNKYLGNKEDEFEQIRVCFQYNEFCSEFKKWTFADYKQEKSVTSNLDSCYGNCFKSLEGQQWYQVYYEGEKCYQHCRVDLKSKWSRIEELKNGYLKFPNVSSSKIVQTYIIFTLIFTIMTYLI